MNSNKNIPQLRFPEFKGEWDEKVLSECLEERNEQFPENENYPLMAFVAGRGVSPKGEKYDRSALVKDATNKKYKRTELGDFIYSSNNLEAGSIGFNTYGSACISPVYSIFKSKNSIDSTFIGTLLTQRRFIAEMVKYRQGVVYGQWKIPESEFLKMRVSVPSPDEQQKIAECLSEIDNLIAAHGEKVDALKEKKKGMMQQMFPKQGETTPRLRFPGFTGEWEEKKLGEVCERLIDKVGGLTLVPISVSAGIGIISQKERFGKNISGKQYKNYIHITKGDYCYNKGNSKQFPQGCIYELKDFIEAAAPNAFISFRFYDNVCSHFFNGYFDQNYHGKQLAQYITSGARSDGLLNLNAEDFFKIKFMVPKTLAEQQKIAECLSSMDNMIASESAKLDALKDHKKGLMQQLFPQPNK